jgi:hypothetical protein
MTVFTVLFALLGGIALGFTAGVDLLLRRASKTSDERDRNNGRRR